MKARIVAVLSTLALLLGLGVATPPAAQAVPAVCAGTMTRETFSNHHHWGVDYKVRYQTNYTQCTGTVINWMQICVVAGAAYLNAPKIYDIDYWIFNVKTGKYERWYLNAATSGTGTCRTWYPNEPVSSLDVNASYWATLNTNLAPDLRVTAGHSL